MSNRKILLTGACVLACLAGGGALATAGDEGVEPAPPPEAEAAQAEPVTEVPAEQAEQLRQLERPRTGDDALPEQLGRGADRGRPRPTSTGAPIPTCRAAPPRRVGDAGRRLRLHGQHHAGRGRSRVQLRDAGGRRARAARPGGHRRERQRRGDRRGARRRGRGDAWSTTTASTRTVAVERNTYRAAIDANTKEVRFTDADGGEHVAADGLDAVSTGTILVGRCHTMAVPGEELPGRRLDEQRRRADR